MKPAETVLFGIAVGAGLMYLLDPERGARRRALLRDQLARAGHELEDLTTTGARRVRNRAIGLAHEARADLTEKEVDDRVLIERVRSEIGRVVSNPRAIEVEAHRGHIILSGAVHSNELQRLVRAVKAVRGVERVDTRVNTGEIHTPDLQGVQSH